MRRIRVMVLVAVLGFLLIGINIIINNKNGDLYVANTSSVKLEQKVLNIKVGDSVKLNVTGDGDLIWASSNKKIATVDTNGNIKAVSEGTTYIIVALKDNYSVRDTCKIVVAGNSNNTNNNNNTTNNNNDSIVKKEVDVSSISLNNDKMVIEKDETEKLEVIFSPINATNKKVSWKSSDTSVVSVDTNGNVKGLKAGGATITVISQANSKAKASCVITVNEQASTVENSASAHTKKFLETLKKMSKQVETDVKKGKKWKYSYKGHVGNQATFWKARSSTRKLSCVNLPSWALIDMGILKSGQIVANQCGKKSGKKCIKTYTWYHGNKDTAARVKKYFKFIDGKNQKAATLIKNGTLKAGDIVFWKHYHTSVYAGSKKWYDSGRAGSNGATSAKPYFKTFGPVSIKSANETNRIRQILRFKS